MLTYFGIRSIAYVKHLCHSAKSAGGRLHLNTHADDGSTVFAVVKSRDDGSTVFAVVKSRDDGSTVVAVVKWLRLTSRAGATPPNLFSFTSSLTV